MKVRLLTFCDDYRQAPAMYNILNEQALAVRYADLQLRDTTDLRLSHLCSPESDGEGPVVAASPQP